MQPTVTLKKIVFFVLAFFAFRNTYCSIRHNSNNYIGGNNNYISNSNDSTHIRNENITLQSDTAKKTIDITVRDGWTVRVNKKNITGNNEDNGQIIKVEASVIKPFLFGVVCGTVASFGLVIAIGKAALKKQQANPATRRSL